MGERVEVKGVGEVGRKADIDLPIPVGLALPWEVLLLYLCL